MTDKKDDFRITTLKDHKNILLAIDDTLILAALMSELPIFLDKAVGFPAYDIKKVEALLDNSPPPELIILDTQLREDRAKTILKLLVSCKARIPVILLDVNKYEDQTDFSGVNMDTLNIVGCIRKPIDYKRLFDIIKRTLKRETGE